jgi:predicted transport protein
MYMCPVPNGFRDGAISLYSYKIVDKKEIARTVSNTGIYCSSDEVNTVYLV